MSPKHRCFPAILLLLATLSVRAEERVQLEPEQRYLLLSTMKTSTMQAELDEVAAKGFRVLIGSSNSAEMVLFLERLAQPPDTYKYRLLATTKTGTMQKELQAAAQEGFRLLSRSIMYKKGMMSNEVVAILERSPKLEKNYEYLLLATSLTSTLQKEVSQAQANGFALAGLISGGERMVIMEKETRAK